MPRTATAVRHGVAADTARRVWAQISRTPTASVSELAAACGLGRATAQQAIDHLVDLGYVERQPRGGRARRVLVPFCVLAQQEEHA